MKIFAIGMNYAAHNQELHGTYPFNYYDKDPETLEEKLATERNLLYVAMTRARENLYILCTEKNKSRFSLLRQA